ncbi:MAG: T9SS type A sorting domain-containing protein [Saprospiraceae bacterium]|nr:T9SS type A sorting domain-containing protein [Saprospiraceae bacterium]
MSTKRYIISLVLSTAIALGSLYWYDSAAKIMAITVNAGRDTSMCIHQTLLLNALNASIEGEVTDGLWVRIGDGFFQPGNLTEVRFGFAKLNNISYVPGNADKNINRQYELLLVSDPGTSPAKDDRVRITFQTAPPLFCASNINISLNENCIQVVNASMLQPNPAPPLSHYIVTLYDAAGKIIPNNTLSREHIDKEITYKLGHQCTPNICWGKFRVEDYFPPLFVCTNDTIPCTKSITPESVGLPIPAGATIVSSVGNRYVISGWDACSNVTLDYTDEIIKANCDRDEDRTVIRKWKAIDAKGNMSTCEQRIVVKRVPLSAVTFPPHYDNKERPALECGQNFPVLPNGHPSPDTTGIPGIGFCGHLQFKMTDVRFDLCGSTFKIARSWFVIDWCTSESITRNQIIMIADTKPPLIECRDTLRIQTGVYSCTSIQTIIPELIKSSDCNKFSVQFTLRDTLGNSLQQHIILQAGKPHVSNLPVGVLYLNNVATDTCGNTSICPTVIIVEDKIAPSVACDQVTKVSLGPNGIGRVLAQTFDDGSIDNCGIASFMVRKMTDKCGFNTVFADYVDFCCDEIGSSVLVALQVTDIYGNRNTCMVEAIVEDKLKPTLTCPPNLTLSCTDAVDLNNLDIYGRVVTKQSDVRDIKVINHYHNGTIGKDGLAVDNCKVTVSQKYTADIKCDTGTIIRTFIARDSTGLTDSCKQIITIRNPNPFNGNDTTQLKWPKNYEGQGCRNSSIHPSVTGKPQFMNDACGRVESTYDDTPFYIADSACVKIIRKWTVVDWCQFSTATQSTGKWGPYFQIIKLHNYDKPEFTSVCKDTLVCSYDDRCRTGRVNVSQSAKDSCTAVSDLIWKFELDIFNDGTIDSTGVKNDFEGDLPLGKHKISWRVEDQCGNFNTCSQFITIRDCKNPVPYCLSSLTISLMQGVGSVEIWARDFDKGSADNCTLKDSLLFTFWGELPVSSMIHSSHFFKGKGVLSNESEYQAGNAQRWIPQTRSSGLYFDCGDIPDGKSANIPLAMTVTDHNSNQDSCIIELILQDNTDHCPDVITSVNIAGSIFTSNGKVPQNIEVNIETPESQRIISSNNQTGKFLMERLKPGQSYSIKPFLNSDPIDGVSTFDLIKIQRHILDIEPFDSAYKFIAADVNSSSSVTAGDLVEIRKLILGITDKFPKGLPSWVFLDKEKGIPDPKNPHKYISKIETGVLQKDMNNADFVAVKIGDVNFSALNLQDQVLENRTQKKFLIQWERVQKEGKTYLHLRAGENAFIDGFQLFLDIPEAETLFGHRPEVISDFFAESDVFVAGQFLRTVVYSNVAQYLKKDEIMLTVILAEHDQEIRDITFEKSKQSEIYSVDRQSVIHLKKYETHIQSSPDFRLLSNPVYNTLVVKNTSASGSGHLDYSILDINGKSVDSGNISIEDESTISLKDHVKPGVYILRLHHHSGDQSIKFIRIK